MAYAITCKTYIEPMDCHFIWLNTEDNFEYREPKLIGAQVVAIRETIEQCFDWLEHDLMRRLNQYSTQFGIEGEWTKHCDSNESHVNIIYDKKPECNSQKRKYFSAQIVLDDRE